MKIKPECIDKARDVYRLFYDVNIRTSPDLFIRIAELLQSVADEATRVERERCAKLCEEIPLDLVRCNKLQLTSQAWEEGQYACAKAIRGAS
jgi:hypothetical protein